MNVFKNIVPRETIVALADGLSSEDFLTVVRAQRELQEAAEREAKKAWEMYLFCSERGQSGRRYISKYNALTKQIEGGY
jgi:hypothetical protein